MNCGPAYAEAMTPRDDRPEAAEATAALHELLGRVDPAALRTGAGSDEAVATTTLLLGHLTELTTILSTRRAEAVRQLLQNESGAAVATRHQLTRQTINKIARRS